MSGLPKSAGANTTGACTGDWACSVAENDQHCVCVNDAPAGRTVPCCQCGSLPPRHTPTSRST